MKSAISQLFAKFRETRNCAYQSKARSPTVLTAENIKSMKHSVVENLRLSSCKYAAVLAKFLLNITFLMVTFPCSTKYFLLVKLGFTSVALLALKTTISGRQRSHTNIEKWVCTPLKCGVQFFVNAQRFTSPIFLFLNNELTQILY